MSDTTTLLIDDDDFMAAAQHLLSKIYSSTAVTEKLKILANPVYEKDKLFIRKMEFLVGKNSVHDFASNELPDHVQRFDITLFVGYEPEDIVFLKYPFSFIQRWQRTVLCYLHAASVVQHYSVSRATGRPAKTLDVNNYVRNYFSNFTLRRHLEGVGTCSEQVLRNIILPCMDNGLITTNEICRIVELLKLKGVALLSKFPVEPEFKDPQRFHYHGAPQVSTADPDDGTDRLHSMCIVGNIIFPKCVFGIVSFN